MSYRGRPQRGLTAAVWGGACECRLVAPKRRLFELADWSVYWGEADALTQRRDARCAPRRKLRFRKSERASSSSATSRRQRSASICMAGLLQSSNEDNTAAAYARLDRDNGGIRSAEAQPMSCAKAGSQDSSGCLLSSSRIWAARSSGSAISAACCQAKEREHLDM
jgi:hypothetical protein